MTTMKNGRLLTTIAAAALCAGTVLASPGAATAADSPAAAGARVAALGCGAYEGAVKKQIIYWYARVYNACGSSRQMRAVVDGWPDGPCEWVGAYSRADLYAGVYAPSGTADC
ncbi:MULTISPECIES: hypothetical protein [unclassified Nonomuraea]|uniref:hypothetical protein n=1 Tax=unclassified Nonomuraea TaxID=2593643 RepID=UPI0033D9D9BF